MGTASADPERLEDAAAAVPAEVKDALEQAVVRGGLASKVDDFARQRQHPLRLGLSGEALVGALATARSTGNELDTRLVRIAAEFRRAGGYGRNPEGPQDRVAPPANTYQHTMYMDDAALQAGVDQWGLGQGPEFRQDDDGRFRVLGPDGRWYLVVTSPPPGAPLLGRTQGTNDFTNPDSGAVLSAAAINGFMGGSTDPHGFWAPREAYRYVQFDGNGMPIVGTNAGAYYGDLPEPVQGLVTPGDLEGPTGDRPYEPANTDPLPGAPKRPLDAPVGKGPLDSPAGRGAAAIGVVGGIAEYAKHTDVRNKNIFHTQVGFYVDPRTGQRVAVANVASIGYWKPYEDGDPSTEEDDRVYAVVRWGRLAATPNGRPTVVTRCDDPGFSAGGTYRFPIEAVD